MAAAPRGRPGVTAPDGGAEPSGEARSPSGARRHRLRRRRRRRQRERAAGAAGPAGPEGLGPPPRPPERLACREGSALCLLASPCEAYAHQFTNPIRSVLGCWQRLCSFYLCVYIYIYMFPPPFSRARGFERHPGPADGKWQVPMKDKYRAAFFQLGGQIPSGFMAAVIFLPLGKKKKTNTNQTKTQNQTTKKTPNL